MYLVYKQYNLAAGVFYFFNESLESVLKLAAEFGSGNEGSYVQHYYLLIFQRFRHFATDDFLREPFNNGRFPHTRLAYQNRIVLRAAA